MDILGNACPSSMHNNNNNNNNLQDFSCVLLRNTYTYSGGLCLFAGFLFSKSTHAAITQRVDIAHSHWSQHFGVRTITSCIVVVTLLNAFLFLVIYQCAGRRDGAAFSCRL